MFLFAIIRFTKTKCLEPSAKFIAFGAGLFFLLIRCRIVRYIARFKHNQIFFTVEYDLFNNHVEQPLYCQDFDIIGAFVIEMNFARFTRAAFSDHKFAALGTDKFTAYMFSIDFFALCKKLLSGLLGLTVGTVDNKV